MKWWINFNLNHPRTVITMLIIITALSFIGFKKLHFDGSTDALLPKDEIIYKLGQRAKKVFGDSKTFIVAAIEPAKGEKLFSYKTFSYINSMVEEIEEYKDFNYTVENNRLNTILSLANVKIQPQKQPLPKKKKLSRERDTLEDELDSEIFDDDTTDSSANTTTHQQKKKPRHAKKESSIWDLSENNFEDFYVKAIRKRNTYNYETYKPVSISDLISSLDPKGVMQLKTILLYQKLDAVSYENKLTPDQFTTLLESWETIYLYKSMEIVKSFINPISGEDISGSNNELKPVDFVPEDENGIRKLPATPEEFEEYKKTIFKNPTNKSSLFSLDQNGNIQALALNMLLRPKRDHYDIYNYLFALIDKYRDGPIQLTVSGIPVYQTNIMIYMRDDLKKLLPLVLLMVVLIFYVNFRLLRGVILPSISVIMGMVWTMGLLGLCGIPITVIVNMLPTLLIAVASSYSIHIFNQYMHDQQTIHTQGKKKGLFLSMNHISLTVLLASLTTFIGFATLSTNQVMSLRHFGIFAAIGTLFAMIVTVMLIPSALMQMKLLPVKKDPNERKETNYIVQKIISFFNYLVLKKSKAVCITAFIAVIIFAAGIGFIIVETSPLYNFKEDSALYQLDLRMSELFEGTIALNLVIDSGKKNGVKDPDFLRFIDEVRTWLTSEEGKRRYHHLHTYSFSDVIKRMHKAMNNDDDAFYKIPSDRATIEDYIQIYSGEDRDSDGRIDTFEQFVDVNFREANIILRTGNYKDETFSTHVGEIGIERIQKYMKKHPIGKKYKWHLVGEPFNFVVLAKLVIRGQIKTILLTLIIIAVIMLFLFKNLKASLVSIVPITSSIILVYGLMGYLNIPLDIPKSLLAVLAIGIGVDDTIHMFKTLRFYISKGMNIQDAITSTHKEAGVAIVYTSLALILGFSVFMFSEFKPVFYLGWLVALTMFATTITALVLLPSIINLFKIDLKENLKWKILQRFDLSKIFNLKD